MIPMQRDQVSNLFLEIYNSIFFSFQIYAEISISNRSISDISFCLDNVHLKQISQIPLNYYFVHIFDAIINEHFKPYNTVVIKI